MPRRMTQWPSYDNMVVAAERGLVAGVVVGLVLGWLVGRWGDHDE